MLQAQSRSDLERTYIPSVRRLLLVNYLLPIAAAMFGVVISYVPELLQGIDVNWRSSVSVLEAYLLAATVANLLLIGLNRDWFAIKIDAETISGPALFGGRKSIRRTEIDQKKTAQQSGVAKLLGSRQVSDTCGNNISLSGLYFSSEQINEILANVGCV